MLTVGGVATTVYIPQIAYNAAANKLLITVKNADGTYSGFYVPVVSENASLFFQNDVTTLLSPIGTTKVLLSFGYVPSNNAAGLLAIHPAPLNTAAYALEARTYAGVEWDQLLRASGKLPVIINPAQALLTGYTFEIIKQNGSLYPIQPGPIVEGFDGAFAQFAAAPSNGLYTLPLNPTKAAAVTASTAALYPAGYPGGVAGESYELAVRATKAGREVFTGYQYAIKVQQDVNTVYTYKAGLTPTVAGDPFFVAGASNPAIPWKVYVPIGTTKNILDYYALTATQADLTATTATTLTNAHFYKSSVDVISTPGNVDVESFVSTSGTNVTTSITNATVTNLNMRTIPFKLTTFDWMARYYTNQKNISVVFYSALNNAITAIPVGTQVLTTAASPADQKVVVLTSMFTELDAVGKTELWRTQATNVEVKLTYGSPAVNIPGVTYEFLDANNNVIAPDAIGTWGPVLTSLLNVQTVRKVRFTFDENTALPGNYTGVLQFTDRRVGTIAGINTGLFTVAMPFTVANPDMTTTINNMKEHKANLFVGQLLTVYGTYPSVIYPAATAQTWRTNAYYDLYNAYQKLYDPTLAPAAQIVPVNHWQFVKTGAAPVPNPMTAGLGTIATSTDRFIVNEANMYTATPFNVQLWYYYFGNPLNKVLVETIEVKAHSEVYDGTIETLVPPVASGLPATLQVLNGDLVTVRNLSDYARVKDYLGVNVFAFGKNNAGAVVGLDTRIDPANPSALLANNTGVVVKNQSLTGSIALSHLVAVSKGVAGNPNEWTVKATNAVASIVADIQVPITVEVTDLFGKTKKYEVMVLVKKP
jgi:hypothetical protein